jgi:hypothetical protein
MVRWAGKDRISGRGMGWEQSSTSRASYKGSCRGSSKGRGVGVCWVMWLR